MKRSIRYKLRKMINGVGQYNYSVRRLSALKRGHINGVPFTKRKAKGYSQIIREYKNIVVVKRLVMWKLNVGMGVVWGDGSLGAGVVCKYNNR